MGLVRKREVSGGEKFFLFFLFCFSQALEAVIS
jgi:hypothetical protein